MTTPVQIINLALKQCGVLGVGQTASAEDISDSFATLNMMLAQWSVKRNIVHQILDTGITTDGRQTYTVGPGGDFNIGRPARLAGAYCRQFGAPGTPVDYPLELLLSQTDYARVSTKQIKSMPSTVYYDPQYPMGTLYCWPVPIQGYELHILTLAPLQQFATPYDDINLPPEYLEPLMYNLAGRLYALYGLQPNPVVIALASAGLQTIRQANAQIGRLQMPGSLIGTAGYNFYSDN